jgi:hypothetical protein
MIPERPKPHPPAPRRDINREGWDMPDGTFRPRIDGLPPVYACTMVSVYRVRPEEPRACECPKCGAPIALSREPVTCSYCRWVVKPA